MTKVVELGPKFWKKLAKQKRKTKAFVAAGVAVSLSKPNPALTGKRRLQTHGEYKKHTHDDEENSERAEAH